MNKNDIVTRLALLELENKFAISWDSGDADKHASLYAENAVFEMEAAGLMPATKLNGREKLNQFCSQTNRDYPGLHLFDINSFNINRRGSMATGSVNFEFCFFANSQDEDCNTEKPMNITGVYHSTYIYNRRNWHIQRRNMSVAEQTSTGVYSIPSMG